MVTKKTKRAFYRQVLRHVFASGWAMSGGGYLDGLELADSTLGRATIDYSADLIIDSESPKKMAVGGLVTSPTLALLGEAGPELVVPLVKPKRTRKRTDYDRRLKRALLEINKTARLKNGSWRKGWDQAKVMKKAHKLARKYGPSTKKGQVRKTARRAYRK